MERPPGLLGQLWDRFGPTDSSAFPAAIAAVVIEAGPEELPRTVGVELCSPVRTASLPTPSPITATTVKQENSAFGSAEDLERYLNETSRG
jgi:hypothetical protein